MKWGAPWGHVLHECSLLLIFLIIICIILTSEYKGKKSRKCPRKKAIVKNYWFHLEAISIFCTFFAIFSWLKSSTLRFYNTNRFLEIESTSKYLIYGDLWFFPEFRRFWRGFPQDYVLNWHFFGSDFFGNDIVNHGISFFQMNLAYFIKIISKFQSSL